MPAFLNSEVKMNYFELIQKTLVELNYTKVKSFDYLIKNDHEKIKNTLNLINAEVLSSEKWGFMLRKLKTVLTKNLGEIENPVYGKIHSIKLDEGIYNYSPDFNKFLLNAPPLNTYSLLNDKILFPTFATDKDVEILYFTNNFAKDEEGTEIPKMTNETDKSQIPEPFVEPILVYGACLRIKANPQYPKFNYWYGMYKDALSNLRYNMSNAEEPNIRLFR